MSDIYVLIGEKCTNCDAFGFLPNNEHADERIRSLCPSCTKGWKGVVRSMPLSEASKSPQFLSELEKVRPHTHS